jgi:hypothetical protein
MKQNYRGRAIRGNGPNNRTVRRKANEHIASRIYRAPADPQQGSSNILQTRNITSFIPITGATGNIGVAGFCVNASTSLNNIVSIRFLKIAVYGPSVQTSTNPGGEGLTIVDMMTGNDGLTIRDVNTVGQSRPCCSYVPSHLSRLQSYGPSGSDVLFGFTITTAATAGYFITVVATCEVRY